MKNYPPFFLLIIFFPILSCEKDKTNISSTNPVPVDLITFKKQFEHGELSVKQTVDGGFIIAGHDYLEGGSSWGNVWLSKLDKYGNKEWENTYSLGAFGYTHSVIQTSDGGYLYAGWEGIVKADSNGLEEWKNKNSELGLYPTYEDVIQHSNGNYYAVGGPSGGQAQFVKFSPEGNVLTRKYFGTNCEDDIFRSIIEAPDGMLIIVGEKAHGEGPHPCSFNFMYYKDFWIIKVKKNGGLIWEKTYGGDYLEQADDIISLESGGYAVIGNQCIHESNLSSCDWKSKLVVFQISEEGDYLTESTFSGLKFLERMPYYSITTTAFGGLAWTAEHRNKGTWIHKWGPNEDTVSIFSDGFGGFEINSTHDNGFVIGTWRGELIKTDSELFYEDIIEER